MCNYSDFIEVMAHKDRYNLIEWSNFQKLQIKLENRMNLI